MFAHLLLFRSHFSSLHCQTVFYCFHSRTTASSPTFTISSLCNLQMSCNNLFALQSSNELPNKDECHCPDSGVIPGLSPYILCWSMELAKSWMPFNSNGQNMTIFMISAMFHVKLMEDHSTVKNWFRNCRYTTWLPFLFLSIIMVIIGYYLSFLFATWPCMSLIPWRQSSEPLHLLSPFNHLCNPGRYFSQPNANVSLCLCRPPRGHILQLHAHSKRIFGHHAFVSHTSALCFVGIVACSQSSLQK